MSSQLARALGALRLAVQSLKIHYTNRHLAQKTKDGDGDESSRERHTRLFYPYKTCYISNTGAPIDFRYLRRMDSTNLLFLCETATTTATTTTRKLCIKFTRKYSPDAHQYCATNGVAPELYAVESLPGGWIMVVMDYLDEESYKHLLISHVPQVKLAPEVQRVVSVLHAGGFVHGDIRGVNLMVRRNWNETDDAKNVLLVDFDWAGPTGSTYYPPNVNRVDIPRPDGAKDGEPISKEHDLWMVEQIVGQVGTLVSITLGSNLHLL
jgi:serine/threonine protein kinase